MYPTSEPINNAVKVISITEIQVCYVKAAHADQDPVCRLVLCMNEEVNNEKVILCFRQEALASQLNVVVNKPGRGDRT